MYWCSCLILIAVSAYLTMLEGWQGQSFNWVSELSQLSLTFSLNNLSVIFFSTVCVISISVFGWGMFYMSGSYKLTPFYLTLFVFVSSMLLLLLSGNLMTLFIGWEGLGLSSFILIIFYQNWMSVNSGLLTLLTNRAGDALLLLTAAYWLNLGLKSPYLVSGVSLLLFLVVSFTKSAQWPFTSWLPAAMAAPTPVSALVHSSTLVTAGLWLVIRFSEGMKLSFLAGWVGLGTLTAASFAALIESDAKKVVALSTLSQLGLMFFSIVVSNLVITLFHIVTHALAKANLFMLVGSLLHAKYSEQDSRKLASSVSPLMVMSSVISILSLSGVMFLSGFYSKEQILFSTNVKMTTAVGFLLVVVISTATLSYCIKLIQVLTGNSGLIMHASSDVALFPPIVLMTSLTISAGGCLIGLLMVAYLMPYFMTTYWLYLIASILFVGLTKYKVWLYTAFSKTVKATTSLSSTVLFSLKPSMLFHSSLESLILMNFAVIFKVLLGAMSSTITLLLLMVLVSLL